MSLERPSWSQSALPKAVSKLVYLYGAFIVGSQAELYAKGLRPSSNHDWDILVPWIEWRRAAHVISMDAVPNGNRGWRFAQGEVVIDVWPDEVARFLGEATSEVRVRAKPGQMAYAASPKSGLVISALRMKE